MSERQFGFRNKRSTVDNITKPTEHIRLGLDSLDETRSVFLDLTKAFDTVDHNFLLLKCESYGLTGCVYNLLKSYLSDRKQFVQIGDKKSAVQDVKYGVPQGSVLGPIVFLLYIDDIERVCQSSEIILLADDTTIYFSTKLTNDDLLNDLGRLCDWFDRNKLTVNFSKCNLTCFACFAKRETMRRLQLQGITLYDKESTKCLGVHIDKKLSFKTHIEEIKSKLKKTIYCFYQYKNRFRSDTLIKLYKLYVQPVLQYCVLIYGCAGKSELKQLNYSQNHLIRIMFGVKKFNSVRDVREKYKLLKPMELHLYELLKLMSKSLRQSFDCGYGSQIFINEEVRNIQSD